MYKELLALNKKNETTDGFYARLRLTGGPPAQLCGLAKTYKKRYTSATCCLSMRVLLRSGRKHWQNALIKLGCKY